MKIEDVIPRNQNVLVEIEKLKEVIDGVYVGNQNAVETDAQPTQFYVGKVHKFGPDAPDDSQCPEIEEGKYAIFSQWSGQVMPTEDGYTKVIPGFNIVAFTKSLDMKIEDLDPTNDRILVEIIQDNKVKDGVYNNADDDPRQSVTQRGRVISCASNADQYEVGAIVFFEPTAGNLIVNRVDQQLKTLNSKSILCEIK